MTVAWGTIPQWIAASGIATLIGIVLRYRLGLRKLALGDEADIRDHYAEELTGLRAERAAADKRYNDALDTASRRLADCEKSGEKHRGEIEELRDKVRGLERQIIRYSSESAIELSASTPSAEVEDAAKRALDEIDKRENGNGK